MPIFPEDPRKAANVDVSRGLTVRSVFFMFALHRKMMLFSRSAQNDFWSHVPSGI
jgi:hypothetical protein